MSIAQWDVLRRTGTAHLMAISGLHVGLVSGLAFGIFSFAWRLPGTSVLLVDARRMGAVAAMAAALAYAALAGFSVPTQRAAVMVVCLMLAMLSRRAVAPSTLLGRALIAVLLLDPFAVNETSFWLSFSAVALILYGVSGRLALRRSTGRALWWRFAGSSACSGSLCCRSDSGFSASFPSPRPSKMRSQCPGSPPWSCRRCWRAPLSQPCCPQWVHQLWKWDIWHSRGSGLRSSGLRRAFPCCRRAPRGRAGKCSRLSWERFCSSPPAVLPARWLGGLWMAPLLFELPSPVPEGVLRVTVLDVGQGLSVVLRTRDHTLVYDTGPRFSDRFDTGAAVVVPFLRHMGVRAVDTLVLSHRHQDHVGGAASVARSVNLGRILTNVSSWEGQAVPCRTGQEWHWNGARFTVLHPPPDGRDTGNEGSCVIRATIGKSSVLLTGDIEERSERELLERVALHSDCWWCLITAAEPPRAPTSSTRFGLDSLW